jgi:hypothetical protein
MLAPERTYETNTSFLAGNNGYAIKDTATWKREEATPIFYGTDLHRINGLRARPVTIFNSIFCQGLFYEQKKGAGHRSRSTLEIAPCSIYFLINN